VRGDDFGRYDLPRVGRGNGAAHCYGVSILPRIAPFWRCSHCTIPARRKGQALNQGLQTWTRKGRTKAKINPCGTTAKNERQTQSIEQPIIKASGMTEIKVESGIPVKKKYPFEEMKVNDSFAIPTNIQRTTVAVAAKRYGDKHKMKFIVRIMEDRTYRCWRIK
jgi:hypothetical protein